MSDVVLRLNFGDENLVTSSPTTTQNPSNRLVVDAVVANGIGRLHVTPNQRRMHYLYQEFAAIAKEPIEGIYISQSSLNFLDWFGFLIVRAGIYCGGMFRFKLFIPDDFPDTKTMPVVKFEDSIFHPLINSKTNIADLTRYFPSGWQRDRNHMYQIIIAVQNMFFRCQIDAAQAANPEAAILVAQDRKKFTQLARETVCRSRTQIYEVLYAEDENAINFNPWNEPEMEPFRKFLIGKLSHNELCLKAAPSTSFCANAVAASRNKKFGFSWVNPTHCQYMCDLLPMPKQKFEKTVLRTPTSSESDSPLSPDVNYAFKKLEKEERRVASHLLNNPNPFLQINFHD